MKKTWNTITAMLLAALLVLPLVPKAAATEKSTVDPDSDTGAITLTLQSKSGGKADNVDVAVYRVGTGRIVDSNLVFELVGALMPAAPAEGQEAETPVELNGLSAEQNTANAAILKTKIAALQKTLAEGETLTEKYGIVTLTGKTDKDGVVTFTDVPVGVYLVVQTSRHEDYYNITPFLLYLPYTLTNEDGNGIAWEYDVEAGPKVSARPSGGKEDPPPPEEILDPEVPTDPDVIPEEPGEEILEPEVPLDTLPQTGLLQWPVPVMTLAGLLLIAAGLLMEQRKARKARRS